MSSAAKTQKLKKIKKDFSGFDIVVGDEPKDNSVDLSLFVAGGVKPNETGVIGKPNLEKQPEEVLNRDNDFSGFEFAEDVGEDNFNYRIKNKTKTRNDKFSCDNNIEKPNILKRSVANKKGYAYLEDKKHKKEAKKTKK